MKRNSLEHIFRESETHYKRLLEHLTDYVYTVSVKKNGNVETYHGPGCKAVTGYESEDYFANPELWHQMVYVEDRERVIEISRKALAGEKVPPLEHRILHRDGGLRWVRNTIVLENDSDGHLKAYHGLIKDISLEKEADRRARLKEKQLIQADKMVALGTLSAGVAHEINNPNNFILLNTQLLKDIWKDANPILEEYYQREGEFLLAGIPYSQANQDFLDLTGGIVEGATRINKIVKNLKTFSRKDPGSLSALIDMNDVVESAIPLVDNLLKKSTNHFRLSKSKNLPKVRGNKQQLEQVLINLIINACHALTDPEQMIHVSTNYEAEHESVLIKVVDMGRGILAKNLNHIFDPFFTTKRDLEGTGLGLSISYQIVKDHGGNIYCESEPDVGTSFTVRLPIVKK